MTKPTTAKYIPALRFHCLTPIYDVIVGCTGRERTIKQALIGQADIQPGQQVLDLATGTGTLAIWAGQHQPEALLSGIDGDARVLRIARNKARQADVPVQFAQALSWQLPCRAETFDRVLTSMFFHHLSWPDKVRTVREICRVLKPGAQLHVADWGRPANAVMRAAFLIVQLLDGFSSTRDHASGSFDDLFDGNGFVDTVRSSRFNTLYGTVSLYSARKAGG